MNEFCGKVISKFRVFWLVFALAFVSFPCAFDMSSRFVPGEVPEKVNERFIRGDLGILAPSLGSRYKLIAWRYLSGLPLGPEEQAALKPVPPTQAPASGLARWNALRPGVWLYDVSKQSRVSANDFYTNCLADAFDTAAATLADRTVQYKNDALIQGWKSAQDQVFSNCGGNVPKYPADPDAAMPPLARADRMYQIAAAHFYAEDFDDAFRRFQDIADDKGSPWKITAKYMLARVLLRESWLLHQTDAASRAREQLASLAADPASGRFRDSARRLISFSDSILNPVSAFESLSQRLSVPYPGASFAQSLDEASYVVKAQHFGTALQSPNVPAPFDWLQAMDARTAEPALRRWKQSPSELWLVPALIYADANDADFSALLAAAKKVPEKSPAYDTVTYHSVRLLTESGDADTARAMLDQLLARNTSPLASFENALRGQRMALATSFDDFLRWAPRRQIGYGDETIDPSSAADAPGLDDDSRDVLNLSTPLNRIAAAAHSARIPESIAQEIALVGLARAIVLNDGGIAASVSPIVARAHPGWANDLAAFNKAAGESKRFAGALLVERHAEFATALADSQQNPPWWWCAAGPYEPRPIALADTVLSAGEKREAADQIRKIQDAGPTQSFVAPTVMAWAAAHPNDPRVPEALHRVVRITRYGCRGIPDINGPISKAAFDLLHEKYPDNEWTKKTPYWFKD